MKSHHQVALSVLTLCISQQLYAQNNVNEADAVLDAQTSAELASSTVSDKTPNVTLDTINVTAKARTGTALAQARHGHEHRHGRRHRHGHTDMHNA